jgi:hypothetical protein
VLKPVAIAINPWLLCTASNDRTMRYVIDFSIVGFRLTNFPQDLGYTAPRRDTVGAFPDSDCTF